MIDHLIEQWLICWIFAPQGVEADLLSAEIDLTAHQPMRPVLRYFETSAEQLSVSKIVSASQEDEGARDRCAQSGLESFGETATRGGLLAPADCACTVGADVACAHPHQLLQALEAMTLPDLGLPQAIKRLDRVL